MSNFDRFSIVLQIFLTSYFITLKYYEILLHNVTSNMVLEKQCYYAFHDYIEIFVIVSLIVLPENVSDRTRTVESAAFLQKDRDDINLLKVDL